MKTPPSILIVDDHAANRETVAALLDTPEFRLIEASNGAEALRLAALAPPDLILLDVMMPGMDGFEVCRRLRADLLTAEVPIIMLTALDDPTSRLAGIEAGADDFVSKPFNRSELRARVKTITRLNRYRRLHEQREQFQWVVENAAEGYVQTNARDEIIFANAQARLWLGLPTELSDSPILFLTAARRVFTPQPAEDWVDWLDDRPANAARPRLLVQPESSQSHAFFLEVSVHANTAGRLLRLDNVTESMSQRREQRSFQAMISHKLRTPLNGLQGGLSLLAEPESLDATEIAELTEMAQESADRLSSAISDVLRFVELSPRSTSGRSFPLDRLDALVHAVAASLTLSTVEVDITAEAQGATLTCTAETLEWILFELLENAKKFHPQGTPVVQVVATRDQAGNICVSVSDDGCSLSLEELSKATTPFFQGGKYFTGEVPGMGLGLATVVVALWQNGGSCRLSNRQSGPGVRVHLKWPAVPDTPPDDDIRIVPN